MRQQSGKTVLNPSSGRLEAWKRGVPHKELQYYMSNHFCLGFTKVVYGMLYLPGYHQYSLVDEIGPSHKRDTIA